MLEICKCYIWNVARVSLRSSQFISVNEPLMLCMCYPRLASSSVVGWFEMNQNSEINLTGFEFGVSIAWMFPVQGSSLETLSQDTMRTVLVPQIIFIFAVLIQKLLNGPFVWCLIDLLVLAYPFAYPICLLISPFWHLNKDDCLWFTIRHSECALCAFRCLMQVALDVRLKWLQ